MTTERLLTLREAADRVGLKHVTLGRAIKRGDLGASMLGHRIRIAPAELQRWIDDNRIGRQEASPGE